MRRWRWGGILEIALRQKVHVLNALGSKPMIVSMLVECCVRSSGDAPTLGSLVGRSDITQADDNNMNALKHAST